MLLIFSSNSNSADAGLLNGANINKLIPVARSIHAMLTQFNIFHSLEGLVVSEAFTYLLVSVGECVYVWFNCNSRFAKVRMQCVRNNFTCHTFTVSVLAWITSYSIRSCMSQFAKQKQNTRRGIKTHRNHSCCGYRNLRSHAKTTTTQPPVRRQHTIYRTPHRTSMGNIWYFFA